MDKKKNDDVDYAAAYRQFMNFSHGLSLKQFCEDKGYGYGKLQRYSRKAFWSKHAKLNESEVEESGFMLPLSHKKVFCGCHRGKPCVYVLSHRVL